MKTQLNTLVLIALLGGFSACNPSTSNSTNNHQEGENKSTQSEANTKVRTDDAIQRDKDATKRSDIPVAEANFLAQAAHGGIMEVELSKLALTRASSPQVKEFAKMMVNDHTKANNELKALADGKDVRIPSGLSDENRMKIEMITKNDGKAFDREYMSAMAKDHIMTTELFQSIINDANDSLVKAYASKTLPTLMHHREMAEKLSKTIGTNKETAEPSKRVGEGQNPKH